MRFGNTFVAIKTGLCTPAVWSAPSEHSEKPPRPSDGTEKTVAMPGIVDDFGHAAITRGGRKAEGRATGAPEKRRPVRNKKKIAAFVVSAKRFWEIGVTGRMNARARNKVRDPPGSTGRTSGLSRLCG